MSPRDRETRPGNVAADVPLDSLTSLGAALADRPYSRRGIGQSAEVIRVLVVDDHVMFREGLKALLRNAPDVVIAGEASDGEESLRTIERSVPDVVVMDLDMPGGDGASATAAIAAMDRPPKVLILSMHSEEERLIPLLKSGASGFLSKDAAAGELVDAIRAVAAGEIYVRPRVARLLAASMRPTRRRTAADEARAKLATLSEREGAVLRHVAEGYTGPEIGRKLGITAKTVDTYKQRIGTKLGLAHRAEYVRFALTAGLLAP
jgi:DNA-binding NarL/FixJ family response regulator